MTQLEPGPEGADRQPPLLHQGAGLRGRPGAVQEGRARGGRLLPGPLEPRQGGPLHPRRQLHGLLLVEGVRQGRRDHLGVAADRLSLRRPRQARVRAPRLPPRRGLLLVHLLADARPLSVCPRCTARDVPGREAEITATRSSRGGRSSRTRQCAAYRRRARQGRARPGQLGRGHRDHRRGQRLHRQAVRTGSPASRRSRPCRWSATPPAPASTSSSAPRCSPSTTGTPTCPTPRRRCSATRPTSPSPATGGTRAT